MDKDLHNIEDLFKSGLGDNEEMPSQYVWNNIDNMLDKENATSIRKKYDSLKKISFVLLFLLISLTIYELKNREANVMDNSITKRTGSGQPGGEETSSKNLNDLKSSFDEIMTTNTKAENTIEELPKGNEDIARSHVRMQHQNKIVSKDQKNENSTHRDRNHFKNPLTSKTFGSSFYKLRNSTPEKKDETKTNEIAATLKEKKMANQSSTSSKESELKAGITNGGTVADTTKLAVSAFKEIKNQPGKAKLTARDGKKKTNKTSRFSVSLMFSRDFASYRLKDDKPDNQPDNAYQIQKGERHEFSSTTSALIDYRLNRHWSIQSGAYFSNTNIVTQPTTIYAQQVVSGSIKYRLNTSSGYGYVLPSFSASPHTGDSLNAFFSTHTVDYLGIPLVVKYNLHKGKFSIYEMAGVSANFLIKGRVETSVRKDANDEIEVIDKLLGLKKAYLSGLTGVGVDYNLNKTTALIFAPTLRFALNSINKNTPVKSYPNSFMLSMGIKKQL